MSSRIRSFTLLEVLVIVTLIALVIGIALVAYDRAEQSFAIDAAANMIGDAVTEARLDAVAQNMPVEVRFYDLATGGPPQYSALQLHWLKPDRTTPPINPVLFLPTGATLDATATHSPLIATATQVATPDPSDSRLGADTRAFRFLPDGSTDLNPATNWFLTVRAMSQSDPAQFPSDWASVHVDPATGRAQIYQP